MRAGALEFLDWELRGAVPGVQVLSEVPCLGCGLWNEMWPLEAMRGKVTRDVTENV